MPLTIKREPFTYHDLENFPEDGKRREIIGGELYVTAAPNTKHQRLTGELYGLIWSYLRENQIGTAFFAPTEVVFDGQETVQPDIFLVLHNSDADIAERRIQGSPDWVIEVLSPSNRDYDLDTKRKLYARYGVVYWVVDPEAEEVFNWDEGEPVTFEKDDTATVSVLATFKLDVKALFEAVG